MLARTADNLYWMARYMERAENTARMLGGVYRVSLLPSGDIGSESPWENLFLSTAERDAFLESYDTFDPGSVIAYMALDRDNPSSIRSSIWAARENVRATRHELSAELWEVINHTWLDIHAMTRQDLVDMGLYDFIEWIKERSHLFCGMVEGTMRRGEAYGFWRLGTVLERAENTARLVAARSSTFHRPGTAPERTSDYYQLGMLLRSVNAYKTYREIYNSSLEPKKVAEVLLLHPEMPRSLRYCLDQLCDILDRLGNSDDGVRQANELRGRLVSGRIDRIFRTGLDGFLADFRQQTDKLGTQIQTDFMMIR